MPAVRSDHTRGSGPPPPGYRALFAATVDGRLGFSPIWGLSVSMELYVVVVNSESTSPSRLRWVLAQLGPKAGAQRSKGMLLTAADLGSEWRKADERTWRTGIGGAEAAQRAREAGSITAWRSFSTLDESGWLWCQAVPLVSEPDASDTLARLDEFFLRNLRSKVDVVSEREVEPPVIAGAEQARAFEQDTTGAHGAALAMYLGVRVGSVVGVLSGSGRAASWNLLAGLGGTQVRRVRGVLQQ